MFMVDVNVVYFLVYLLQLSHNLLRWFNILACCEMMSSNLYVLHSVRSSIGAANRDIGVGLGSNPNYRDCAIHEKEAGTHVLFGVF